MKKQIPDVTANIPTLDGTIIFKFNSHDFIYNY